MHVNVKEALKIIIENTPLKNSQKVFLSECLNRVAYCNIKSLSDYPIANKSAMDGYAVVHKNIQKPLKEIFNLDEFNEQSALRINTGNVIPKEANCVVELELTENKNGFIEIKQNVEKFRNFVYAGSEIQKDEIVIKKGDIINAQKRSLLAYLGFYLIDVYQKPIVGIITTGDEVIFPGQATDKAFVYNTNYYILDGFLQKLNVQVVNFGHIKDDLSDLKKVCEYAINRCDVLITTGGASKGTKDYTKETFKAIGAQILFDETTIKPGKPLIFAKKNDKLLFGAPGWPASLMVNYHVLIKPSIKKMCGLVDFENKPVLAKMQKRMHSRIGKDYFNRVILTYNNNDFKVEPLSSQDTSNFYTMAHANALALIDASLSDVDKDALVPVILLDDFLF